MTVFSKFYQSLLVYKRHLQVEITLKPQSHSAGLELVPALDDASWGTAAEKGGKLGIKTGHSSDYTCREHSAAVSPRFR